MSDQTEPSVDGRDLLGASDESPLVRAVAADLVRRFPLGTFDDDPPSFAKPTLIHSALEAVEEMGPPIPEKGDPDFHRALNALRDLHVYKSGSYGTSGPGGDPFRNFTDLAIVTQNEADEYPLRRIIEKAIRQVNLLDQERWDELPEDYLDIAGLAIICHVIAKRRAAERAEAEPTE